MILNNAKVSNAFSLVLGIVLVVAFLLPIYVVYTSYDWFYVISRTGEWEFPFVELDVEKIREYIFLFLPLVAGIVLIVLSIVKIPGVKINSGELNINAILKIALITLPVFLVADSMFKIFDIDGLFGLSGDAEGTYMAKGLVFLWFMLLLIAGLNFIRDVKGYWAFIIPALGGLFFFIYLFMPAYEENITLLYVFELMQESIEDEDAAGLLICVVQLLFYLFIMTMFILQAVNLGVRNRSLAWIRGNFLGFYLGMGLFIFLFLVAVMALIGDSDSDDVGKFILEFFTFYIKLVLIVIPLLLAAAMGPVELVRDLVGKEGNEGKTA